MVTNYKGMFLGYIIVLITTFIKDIQSEGIVIFAVNCGGEEHFDYHSIPYRKDPLEGKVGTASDYGKRLLIGRVPPQDQILYQTERYHDNNFGYLIPVKEDGDYVLVLKFSEVYFNAVDKKVFDIMLNNYHPIVSNLDIYERVGRGVAHDEHVPFTVLKGRLYINNGEESEIKDGSVYLEFIKGYRDNPKINAFYLLKGTLDDVPQLPPIDMEVPEDDFKEETEEEMARDRRPSGPALPDPYVMDDSSMMLPVFIAIGAFIPILFCLCKL